MPDRQEHEGLRGNASRWEIAEEELLLAAAELETAADAAREAGRPVTAEALRRQVRGLQAQRQHLLAAVAASRDGVPSLSGDPGQGSIDL
jgi:hypothetical protein